MSKQDTAVNFLIHSINEDMFQLSKSEAEWKEIFKKAKEMEQTNSIESLIDRNYNAQIRRGQINDKTEPHNFLTKINEELEEVMQSDTWEEMADEVNDLKMVCESFLYFLHKIGYVSRTPQQIHIDKVAYNEKRED